MNTTFVVSLLGTAALFTSIGWLLACVCLAQSHERQAKDLDAERIALDEEREMLNRFWTLDVAPPHRDVEFGLGEHKRLTREVQ